MKDSLKEPRELPQERWSGPLLRVLTGHDDLLKVTSEFPQLGRLGPLGKLPDQIRLPWGDNVDPLAANPVVVVVVVVAVAARPGAVPSKELLQAKLLDVYSPEERLALRNAAAVVAENPELVEATLGVGPEQLGDNFMARLEEVQAALA